MVGGEEANLSPLAASAAETRADAAPSFTKRELLERAMVAEDRAEEAEQQLEDMRGRFRAALGADPTTAVQALSWVGRAEAAEELVRQVLRYVGQRSLAPADLPGGWASRAEAQLRAVDILKRDHPMDRPGGEDYWTTYVDGLGRRGVVRDSTAQAGWRKKRT